MQSETQDTASHGRTKTATVAPLMRAVVQDDYGSADVLRPARIATPTVADDEVLVHVKAAGLDRGAWHVMRGLPYLGRLAFGPRRPKNPVPGTELAGTVVAVGSAVTRFAVGDDVFGIGRGSLAEYAVAKDDRLARKPSAASFEQAAVLGVSAATALHALCEIGRVQAGQTVLVIGASGGVGSYAVQIAAALGARVTGVCSTANLDLVSSLGAEHVVDYTRDDFADGEHHYDLILDIAGNPSLSRLRRALTETGTAVIVGGEEGGTFSGGMNRQLRALVLSLFVRQRLTMFIAAPRASHLQRLADLVENGLITPTIDSTYSLHDAPEAMRRFDSGTIRGKVAITIGAGQG